MATHPDDSNPYRKVEKDSPMFVTWGKVYDTNSKTWQDDVVGREKAMATASVALANADPIINRGPERTIATNIFQNIAPSNTSIREGMSRRDYEMFRPGEQLPRRPKDIIGACMSAYDRIGLVHNVIDMMGDFTAQGAKIVHRNSKINQWCQEWWNRIDGKDRSERFSNLLYRTGSVIVKRGMARITPEQSEEIQKGVAYSDTKVEDALPVKPLEIPWKYIFMNPLAVEVMGEELAPFIGPDGYVYALRLNETTIQRLKKPKSPVEKALFSKIPSNIQTMIQYGNKLLPLPSDKIRVYYYKKDDWQVWANPMIFAILTELRLLEKMKLADLCALDGAVSNIRLWKLGNLEHKILPTDTAINRLAQMLLNNVGGGTMDLIWTPDIELVESKSDVYKFLGEAKYAPVMRQIYSGLGISPDLTGSNTEGPRGFTNNALTLKTMIERLQYGRDVLKSFWDYEFRLLQRAMGWRFPPILTFDDFSLTDDAAIKALYLQLVDRDLISIESIQDRFGLIPEIETLRINKEKRQTEGGKRPVKAGAFHSPQKDHELKKIALQSGTVAPSEVGVELQERKPGETTPMEQKLKEQKAKIRGQAGRPMNKKDSTKRKQRRAKPRVSAQFHDNLIWTNRARAGINAVITPAFLSSVHKKNVRSLSEQEFSKLEKLKLAVLCNMQPFSITEKEKIVGMLKHELPIPNAVLNLRTAMIEAFENRYNEKPTVEEIRDIESSAYSLYMVEAEEDMSGVFLIRHGKTALNKGGETSVDKIKGWMDEPLDAEGKKQAQALVEYSKDLDIEKIYSCDLQRARVVADGIAEDEGLKVYVSKKFRPWNLGELQGNGIKESMQKLKHYLSNPDEKVPDGESFNTFKNRCLPAIEKVMKEYEKNGENIAVVTHSRNIELIEGWLKKDMKEADTKFLFSGDTPTGSIMYLYKSGDKWKYKHLEVS